MAVHLGDGGIVGQFGDEVRLVSVPRKGEFANQTYFVTDADAADQVVVARGPAAGQFAPRGFALFTDGVEGSVLNARTGAVAPAVGKMFDWLRRHPEEAVAEAILGRVVLA